jgi:hypothetical protein
VAPGVVPRVFHRLPRNLQKHALLRIHRRGLSRADPEKPRVKQLDPFQYRSRLDVLRIGQQFWIDAGRDQLFVRKMRNRFDAIG